MSWIYVVWLFVFFGMLLVFWFIYECVCFSWLEVCVIKKYLCDGVILCIGFKLFLIYKVIFYKNWII